MPVVQGVVVQKKRLSNLQILDLKYHGVKKIPVEIKYFKDLKEIDLAHNLQLTTLPSEFAETGLLALHLRGCSMLKTPPMEVANRGFNAVIGYLKRLNEGSVKVTRTKLMMVGLGGAGKTR